MKKFKKILIPFTALTLATTLVACSTNSNSTTQNSNVSKVNVTTSKGDVEVMKNPKNVAVFDIAVLDLMQRYDIKVDNLITPKMSANYVSDLIKDNQKGGSLKEPDYEAISTFKPDVIFAAGRQESVLDELKKLGTVAYFVTDNNFFDSMMKTNMEIAKIFGVEDKVTKDKEKFEDKIKEISDKAKASGKKVLIVMTNEGKITAFGPNSRFGYIHSLFGFEAADANIQESSHGNEINYEYISKLNPDIIFYVDRNKVVQSKTNANAQSTLDNELVKTTNASKNGQIYELDAQYVYLAPNGLTSFERTMEQIAKAVN
ncbi:ABC transporter substrate-binding protein [Gemella sp. GH3]|uniref:siderophore ABC transporter substrate-binding protein n=1 Tax=unclassified Gemella TaxID=2624949 RepID=UPI0015D06FAD|nr:MULTISPECIES: ABC transporter substrate-binding protein [unclassified Gemella]MBF0714196.1 ABC transporter substrate-binding protein [Gemella sp. GH3.1]NYS51148.1 ABC transporter substrate-binding protein [Gemella sp. GH3]